MVRIRIFIPKEQVNDHAAVEIEHGIQCFMDYKHPLNSAQGWWSLQSTSTDSTPWAVSSNGNIQSGLHPPPVN